MSKKGETTEEMTIVRKVRNEKKKSKEEKSMVQGREEETTDLKKVKCRSELFKRGKMHPPTYTYFLQFMLSYLRVCVFTSSGKSCKLPKHYSKRLYIRLNTCFGRTEDLVLTPPNWDMQHDWSPTRIPVLRHYR